MQVRHQKEKLMNLFHKLGKTILMLLLFCLFVLSILYWKIAKRIKPSKKDAYHANEVQCLFCGLVPIMHEFDNTWNVQWLCGPGIGQLSERQKARIRKDLAKKIPRQFFRNPPP